MSRVRGLLFVLGGVIGVIALAIVLMPNGGERTPTSSGQVGAESSATTITIDASDGEVTWGRLRWLLAGLSISAVVLVCARQVMVAAAPPRRRHAVQRRPSAAPASQPARFGTRGVSWIPDGSQVSIGD